jgi:hypothetical protein
MCRVERWSVNLLRRKIGGTLIRAIRVIRGKNCLVQLIPRVEKRQFPGMLSRFQLVAGEELANHHLCQW